MNCVSRVSGPLPAHPLATGHMQDEYVGVYVDGADNVINVPLGRLPFADYRNNLIASEGFELNDHIYLSLNLRFIHLLYAYMCLKFMRTL